MIAVWRSGDLRRLMAQPMHEQAGETALSGSRAEGTPSGATRPVMTTRVRSMRYGNRLKPEVELEVEVWIKKV